MFAGKTVLITGGTSGIGLQTAKSFAEKNANVAIASIDCDTAADGLRDDLEAFGTKIGFYTCDVSDFDAAGAAVKQIAEDFGAVDILINNAGITRDGLLIRMSETDFDRVISINLKGCFNFSRHVSPLMFRKKSGRIINISSVIGLYGNMGQVNYAASKAGVVGLTKSLAKELGSRGITVNAIAPGYIETAMTDKLDEKIKEKLFERIAMRKLGKPEDVANLAVFLASEQAAYITGQVIQVDGCIAV
ncbi:MAG TPA: 3-oxoacyl-[acyl-carrier-protein] reductase [Ruminococcaceae bacterium]|nr:3-oxoacyl-[acyl-carrier-protein] reductase [Oscillospiraceae bacterium]